MEDCIVTIVFGIVRNLAVAILRNLAVAVLLETSFKDRFMKGIFSFERKLVLYNSKPVPLLAIKDLPTEDKNKDDKRKDVLNAKKECL